MYRVGLKSGHGPHNDRRVIVMAQRRKSYQRGGLQWQSGQWTLCYWLLDQQAGKWLQKREREALKDCTDRNNKKAALKAAEPFMARINELNNNPMKVSEALTFADFIKTRWASYLAKVDLQPSTVASYESMIKKHLMPVFGSMRMAEITPGHMTDFFDALRRQVSPKYAANLYALANTMFELAYQYEVIPSKPLRSLLHKPQYEIEEKPVLPVETVRAVISDLDGANRLLVIVLSVFGIRLGEGLALRWLDVDFDGARLAINHSLWRGSLKSPKTKASERKFHIPQSLLNLLFEHQAASPFKASEDFIFCNSAGQPLDPDNLRHRVLYPVLDRLGIKREDRRHGFHIFRHTAGTMLYAKTGNMKLAQEALGHAQMSTTSNIYLHNERVVADTATEVLVDAILGNCDYLVTEMSGMVS